MDIPYKVVVKREYGDRFWVFSMEVIYCDNLTDAEGLRDEIKKNDKYVKGVCIVWGNTVLNYE